MKVDSSLPGVRGAVSVLAILAALMAIDQSRTLLLPVIVAVLLYFLLAPAVRLLTRLRLPRPLATVLVLSGILAGVTALGTFIHEPALEWAGEMPSTARELQRSFDRWLEPVQKAQEATLEATRQVKSLTEVDSSEDAEVVRIEEPSAAETLIADAGAMLASSVISIVLLFFLLATDGAFLRRLATTLPELGEGSRALDFLSNFERQASSYLLTVSAINILLGVCVGGTLWALGMPNPLLWAAVAASLNFIPYLGAVVGTALVGVAAAGSLSPISYALLAPACYLLLTAVEGTLVTPAALGRRLKLSPVAIFLWLLLWNWMWGVPGALIAVPLLVVVKVFCDSFPSLQRVGYVLGRGGPSTGSTQDPEPTPG